MTANSVNVILSIVKNPIRGLTRSEWLERECRNVLGSDEMLWCGSRWRQRIASDPAKMERVLADVRCQQKEGRAIRNSGAYAEWIYANFV